MIYLCSNTTGYMHFFYEDGYIYVHNEPGRIYKKWQWFDDLGSLMSSNVYDLENFDIVLPKILINIDSDFSSNMYDFIKNRITEIIFEKL